MFFIDIKEFIFQIKMSFLQRLVWFYKNSLMLFYKIWMPHLGGELY
jgi:hypothetical protein